MPDPLVVGVLQELHKRMDVRGLTIASPEGHEHPALPMNAPDCGIDASLRGLHIDNEWLTSEFSGMILGLVDRRQLQTGFSLLRRSLGWSWLVVFGWCHDGVASWDTGGVLMLRMALECFGQATWWGASRMRSLGFVRWRLRCFGKAILT